MPEVVNDYVQNHDFTSVAAIQEHILEYYRFDIAKHAKGVEKVKVRKCYDAISKQLQKKLQSFSIPQLKKDKQAKNMVEVSNG